MRILILAGVALALLSEGACSRSETPRAAATAAPNPTPTANAATATPHAPAATATPPPAPLAVFVQAPTPAGPEGEAWARELRAALGARKDEFHVVRREQAQLVVRLEGVDALADGTHVLRGTFLLDGKTQGFTLGYPGPIPSQAERLSRNLRRFADQMKAGAPAGR
jgi:hypothetical protein